MPAEARWLIPDKVIISRYWGKLTIEEMHEVNGIIIECIRNGKNPVHHIVDASQLDEPPVNLQRIREATTYLNEPNLDYVLIFGLNKIAVFLTTVLNRFVKKPFVLRSSLNDCLDVIRIDPHLVDIIDQYRTADV